MTQELVVNHNITIDTSEFDFQFARSSGPGGQNVNKVNSKAQLRWKVGESPSLPDPVRHRFTQKYSNRINNEGSLVLSSDRYRDQGRNVADCLDKLRELILEVAEPPKARKPRKISKGAKRRRLENKRQHSEKKSRRRSDQVHRYL